MRHRLSVIKIRGPLLIKVHVKHVSVGCVGSLLRDHGLRGTLPLQGCVDKQVVAWQGEVREGVRVHRSSTVDLLDGVVLVLRGGSEVIHQVHVGACSRARHGELGSLKVHSGAG